MLRRIPDQVQAAPMAEAAARTLAAVMIEAGVPDVQLWDPNWDREQTGQGVWRVVVEGAYSRDWGVALSLSPGACQAGWYMEPFWGFDVGFVER